MKRNIVWLAVSCLMVVALLLAACAPAAPKEKAVAPKEVVPAAGETTKPAGELPRVSMGATAQGMGVAVTISDTVVTDSYQYTSLTSGEMVTLTAGADRSFLIATVDIKNGGTGTQRMGSGWLRAFDAEGSDYSALIVIGKELLQFDKYMVEGTEIKGKVIFEIPKGASILGLKFIAVAIWEIK